MHESGERVFGFMSPTVIANHHRYVFPDGFAQAGRGDADECGLVLSGDVVESARKIRAPPNTALCR